VQMAVYLVLMPIFEADFHPRSFGFRPGRNAHRAVKAIREALRMGKTEVVDADLAQYFDTIPTASLIRFGINIETSKRRKMASSGDRWTGILPPNCPETWRC
jgi:retron-type reverse transcriptase